MSEAADLKIVPLPPPTDATPDLIAMLEATLERARAGDLESFIMVAVIRGGRAVRARHAPYEVNRYTLLGAVEQEAHTLNRLIDSEDDEAVLFTPDPA